VTVVPVLEQDEPPVGRAPAGNVGVGEEGKSLEERLVGVLEGGVAVQLRHAAEYTTRSQGKRPGFCDRAWRPGRGGLTWSTESLAGAGVSVSAIAMGCWGIGG